MSPLGRKGDRLGKLVHLGIPYSADIPTLVSRRVELGRWIDEPLDFDGDAEARTAIPELDLIAAPNARGLAQSASIEVASIPASEIANEEPSLVKKDLGVTRRSVEIAMRIETQIRVGSPSKEDRQFFYGVSCTAFLAIGPDEANHRSRELPSLRRRFRTRPSRSSCPRPHSPSGDRSHFRCRA